jgi:hypothetical protein
MSYAVKAKDYLARARARLDENSQESLFYAALEIRCGIEARLKEYFDAQSETTKKKRQGWKIAKLAKQVESAFRTRDKIIRLIVFDSQTSELIKEVLYTLVTRRLQKFGEKLGDYLHSQEQHRLLAETWWSAFRQELEATFEELNFAASGGLLAPPLEHPHKPNETFFCLAGDQRDLLPPGRKIGIRFDHYQITYE